MQGSLKIWLKAYSGWGETRVNCWLDQTTNFNHAYYGKPANSTQPIWVADAMNGRPALSFPHTNGLNLLPFATNWSAGEAFIVLRSFGPTTTQPCAHWLLGGGGDAVGSRYPHWISEIHACCELRQESAGHHLAT